MGRAFKSESHSSKSERRLTIYAASKNSKQEPSDEESNTTASQTAIPGALLKP
jgi:hypothetical protein